jgi:hypothetical protein
VSTTTKLEPSSWKHYFDRVSRLLDGELVEIEVESLRLGSQVAGKWLPLMGITYDQKGDLIAVMADTLDHMIRKPRAVFIETEGTQLLSMEVTDDDGNNQVIKFREPLLLPAP